MYLGVDLGGTKISAALLSESDELLAYQRVATPQGDYEATVEQIAQLFFQLESKARLITEQPQLRLPLGIGTPGSISAKTGLMRNANSTCLNGRDLVADLTARIDRELKLANDADCFALAEASSDKAKAARSVFGVILGTGVGGGLVYQNQLLQGHNGICGEWGHNVLPANAPRVIESQRDCYCGRQDCIETYLSGPGLALTWQQLRVQKHHLNTDVVNAVDIAQLAEQGDTQAQMALKLYQEQLACALAQVINVFDPQIIVLGGGVSNMQSLYSQVPKMLETHVFSDVMNTQLQPAQLGDDAGVYGAAWLNR